ncbi:MAG: YaiI/YqxD family protein, partial [Candidatus Hydrogenedens sp.]|nr:YaiI/YqxD family protein [Candidatus Hydrogenedens sp.]
MTRVYIDADACPVKKEACRVAARHQVAVTIVANTSMSVP